MTKIRAIAFMVFTIVLCTVGIGAGLEQSAIFSGQIPADPQIYDAPVTSTADQTLSVNRLSLKWKLPSDGVTTETGVLIILAGINPLNDTSPTVQILDPAWPDSKNVIMAQVFYRNDTYRYPYDFGKYQATDVLRGLGEILDRYPEIDTRRLYLFGGSGGGQVALKVMEYSQHLWAEVYLHSSITKVTTTADRQSEYSNDPNGGWNVKMQFPETKGALSDVQWQRYQAERELRSPQFAALEVFGPGLDSHEERPFVFMTHGDADETVDFRHMTAFREALEQGSGLQAVTDASYPQLSYLQNWTFLRVYEAGHYYPREGVTNGYISGCLTGLKSARPNLILHYDSPASHDFFFRVRGEVKQAAIATLPVFSAATNWHFYGE